ncbi:MAG: hypothetical protein K1X72_00510 [Pyrinomonadaceae bacterium]|nr:hypothetical protein [Pyrinomonadaceae bacterium]
MSLEISGLALCHFMDSTGVWKVFYPRVEGHNFELKITKKIGETDQEPNIFVLPPASKINLSVDGTSVGNREPANWNEAIDLSGKEYHDEPIYLLSNELLYAGVLTLNGANLISKLASKPEKFSIWDARPTQKILIKELTPANIFSSEFQFGSGTAKISVKNNLGVDFELALPQDEGVTYKVEISNDCRGENCEDILDFKFLYKIIDETKFKVQRRIELVALNDMQKKGIPGSRCGGSGSGLIANPDVV